MTFRHFIDLVQVKEGETDLRTSTLIAEAEDEDTTGLTVLGNLPHGYAFKPKRSVDRDALVSWLHTLDYGE